ncbi:uncharacterized protein STEHIDRAFT_21373, partial [Stereum hirsutum FP-91666 SS1]
WQPEPDGRGSFGILSSCVLTLVFCVWTAVHPNVGFQHRPIFHMGESRATLLIIALLSPEVIIYLSWAQNHAVRRLNRQVDTQWTITHSYFACMGGFVFDTTDEEPFLPRSATRIRLQPDGVVFLRKHAPEIIPTLSREEILDKSKADGLSKALACLQTGWFCTQIIARAIQNLPISLLELTTLAHAFCMIAVYLLWWDKPFEVQEPVII